MPAPAHLPFRPLTWLLAAALLLSVGANLYLLTPRNRAEGPEVAEAPGRSFWANDNGEDDDTSWAALTEELRQIRHQLAECQAQRPVAAGSSLPR